MSNESFATRHLGPRAKDVERMLERIGVSSLNELIDKTIPSNIRLEKDLTIAEGICEYDYIEQLEAIAKQNQVFKSYIGMGYHPTVIPAVVQRNVLENPGWYTAYTPYQAEVAQGRLEALLNFQTMVSDLTALPLANASLLDEGTAAGEAMVMMYANRSRDQKKADVSRFLVSHECFPQTLDVLKTRAANTGIELVIGDVAETQLDETFFGTLIQYPSGNGEVRDYTAWVSKATSKGIKVAVAADLLSLALLTPPGEWGADIVLGNTQRFGVPMGYGGPHAAYLATKEEYKRSLPGRIIGVSKDRHGKPALRMALQTREQHIRRDKATSNICTAQALLAVMAGAYAVYHGPDGIKRIATIVHQQAQHLSNALEEIGYKNRNKVFFDTLMIDAGDEVGAIRGRAEKAGINFRYFEDGRHIGISVNETTSQQDIIDVLTVFAVGKDFPAIEKAKSEGISGIPSNMLRSSSYLTHEVFNKYRSETEMMRYLKKLENKDISLVHSMIPLGSCTMKLNAATELMPITWPEFAHLHPFAPVEQAAGYAEVFEQLTADLSEITGFHTVSLQPNSGAQGEYAGLKVIKAYHEDHGDHHRDICLLPISAHGTNPASAVMSGMKVVVVQCDKHGNVDIDDLREKAEKHAEHLAAFMITYPSTHGVFESSIVEMNDIIHSHGGLVYMDGANMNAQVGLTSPGNIGADVCHLNLHKTFAIPHGGGGPGMGPIGVVEKLAPYLPGNPVIETGGEKAISAISSAPWGSALILLISYGYIKLLGGEGLKRSTEYAILNANYIQARLEEYYPVLYKGIGGHVAHEMIVDCRSFKSEAGIEVEDIAKRLMDYGFHAPTVSFPVAGTLMIEPTESESLEELDRFCDAMIQIRQEITAVADGQLDREDNMLKMAPHTCAEVCHDIWNHSYTRAQASHPLSYLHEAKFWPSVGRVDNAHGDRNLICTCPSVESYSEEAQAPCRGGLIWSPILSPSRSKRDNSDDANGYICVTSILNNNYYQTQIMKKIYALICLVGMSAVALAQSAQTQAVKKEFSKNEIFGLTSPKQELPTKPVFKVDVLTEDFEGTSVGSLPDGWVSSTNLDAEGAEIDAYQVITSVEANGGGYWPVPETGTSNRFVGANDDNVPCDCDFLFTTIQTPEMDFSTLTEPAASYDIFHDQGFGGGDGFLEYSLDEGTTWVPVASDACNEIAEFAVNEDVWQTYVTPLADLAGETSVIVRWTWTDAGSWASGFAVDNVIIGDVQSDNLAASQGYYGDWNQFDFGAGVYDFTIIPIDQQSELKLTSIISNNGSTEITGVGFDYSIDQNGSVIGTGSSEPVTLAAYCKDTASVAATGVTPDAVVGTVATTLTTFSDIADVDPSDDSFVVSYEVDQYLYARDQGAAQAFVGPTSDYQYGNLFDMYAEATVYGLDVCIDSDGITGEDINAIIYEFEGLDDDGLPILNDVDESESIEVTENTPSTGVGEANWITIPFAENGIELEAGITYLAVLNTSSDIRTPVSGSNFWVASWLEDADGWGATASAPMVRMNFDPTVSVSEVEAENFTVSQNMPNPFTDETVINYNLNNADNVTLEVFDVTGKQVFVSYEGQLAAGAHNIRLNGADFPAGIYQYTLTVGTEQVTRKMIVQ